MSADPLAVAPSARSQRTRRDIIQAAISCWSGDSAKSLGDVAMAAGVGRTTLNRYFTDRAALVSAVEEESRQRFGAAVEHARPAEGTVLEALQRVCVQIVDLGEVLGLIFADNPIVDPDTWSDAGHDRGDPIGALVTRGQRDGSVAADLPAGWVVTLVWSSLFAAWLALSSEPATRHEVALLMTRTLAGGIGN